RSATGPCPTGPAPAGDGPRANRHFPSVGAYVFPPEGNCIALFMQMSNSKRNEGYMMQALAKCAVAQRKATGAHFTPPDLAALLGRRLLAQDLAEENGEVRVLDPSCGDGQLLK